MSPGRSSPWSSHVRNAWSARRCVVSHPIRPRARSAAAEHTDEVCAAEVTPVSLPAPTREHLTGPLEGVTIIEAAYYYATPFATALLAELGARVIKIEPVRGDPYRLLGRGGGDPVTAPAPTPGSPRSTP